MKKIALTRGKFAIVDDADYESLSRFKWRFTTSGYACRTLKHPVSVYMHKIILGANQGEEGDHINGNKLDNRRRNLRIATSQQNKFNCGKRSHNTSGLKGVCWSKAAKKWQAKATLNHQDVYLGLYTDKHDAHSAYCSFIRKCHGEFAHQ